MQHDPHDTSDLLGGDAPLPGEPNARQWVAEQRFVDGCLRAVRGDADAHEDSIQSILARLDEPRSMPLSWQRPQHKPHRTFLVLAASLLVGLLLWPALFGDPLPEAHASVLRGAMRLREDGERAFAVSLATSAHGHDNAAQQLELTMRPGRRFVVRGALQLGPIKFDDMRFGCDGNEFWFEAPQAGEIEPVRRAGPLDEAPSLLRGIGSVLDMGLLDVHAFVTQLPKNFALKTTKRTTDANGRHLVHVEASGAPARTGFCLKRAEVVCCEETGTIVRLDVEGDDGLGTEHRLSFSDLGPRAADEKLYRRPW